MKRVYGSFIVAGVLFALTIATFFASIHTGMLLFMQLAAAFSFLVLWLVAYKFVLPKPQRPTVEDLTRTLARVIYENDLGGKHGEDTIGVLMRCGAFKEILVAQHSRVIDNAAVDLGLTTFEAMK